MIVGVLKEIKAEENRVCMTRRMPVKAAGLVTRHMRPPALKSWLHPKKYLSAPKW